MGSVSDASRLKLCQNSNGDSEDRIQKQGRNGESSRLSLITSGSSMNAALGNEWAGGVGNPELDVTQRGGDPSALVASHPAGNAGGVMLSKSSLNTTATEQGGEQEGVGGGVVIAVSPATLEASNPLWATRRGELIACITAIPAAVTKNNHTITRNAERADLGFGLIGVVRSSVNVVAALASDVAGGSGWVWELAVAAHWA
jgi:hypothetical protein